MNGGGSVVLLEISISGLVNMARGSTLSRLCETLRPVRYRHAHEYEEEIKTLPYALVRLKQPPDFVARFTISTIERISFDSRARK